MNAAEFRRIAEERRRKLREPGHITRDTHVSVLADEDEQDSKEEW